MTRDEIIGKLKSLKPLFERYGVTRLRLFGSHARDEAGPDSDVDLVVDFESRPTLFKVGGLQDDLAHALGVPADIMTPGAIKPRYRERVLAGAIDVGL